MSAFRNLFAGLLLPLLILSSSDFSAARNPRGYPTGTPISSKNPIGTNLAAGGTVSFEYEGFPLFKNRVRQAQAFVVAGGSTNVALDANGWPAADFQQKLYTGGTNSNISWYSGAFQCGYTSRGNGPTQASGSETIAAISGTIANVSYTSGTKAVLFQLTPTSGVFGYEITGTTGGGGSGGATNVFCYLPEYAGNTSIDNPLLASAFTNEALAFYGANFSFVRFMWFSGALYNTGQNTATTRNVGGPTGNTQTHNGWKGVGPFSQGVVNEGYPFEWAASFCVAAQVDCYYTLPVWEDGTNGNAGSYTNAILAQAASTLIPAGRKLYLEIGNELWNGGYPIGLSGTMQIQGAANGFANSGTGMYQYLGQKLHALANAVRASALAPYLGTQVFIVLATQTQGNGWDNYLPTTLNYMSTTYGAGTPGQDLGYIATAPYTNFDNILSAPFTAFFTGFVSGTTLTVSSIQSGGSIGAGNLIFGSEPGVPNGVTISSFGSGTGGTGTYNLSTTATTMSGPMSSATAQPTVAQMEANLTAVGNIGAYVSAVEHCSLTALHFGMKGYLTYESGWQVNSEIGASQSTGNYTNLSTAQSDLGMSAAMQAHWSTILDAGAVGIANFEDGIDNVAPASTNYSPVDELSYSYNLISAGSPKLAALQIFTPGTYARRRNVITIAGSTIAAGNTADSITGGNAQPFTVYGATPYSGGTNYSNWWQGYSAVARSATLQIGVVSGTANVSLEVNGVVVNPSLALSAGTVSVPINLQAGENEFLMIAPAYNTVMLSGLTY